MSRYSEHFKGKSFLPVIHLRSFDQAMRNAEIAFECGADGIFLINHRFGPEKLMEIYDQVRKELPGAWIGLNLLGASILHVFNYGVESANGIWIDDACITTEDDDPLRKPSLFLRHKKNWKGLYFGGVAFKHTRSYSNDPKVCAELADKAKPFMDVVTTSGHGTGFRAPVEKIKAMKEVLSDFPLGIASGITPENSSSYLQYVDSFLVSTGISTNPDSDELHPGATRQLADIIHTTA